MRDNLNSHGNAPIMTFNSRDVGHIGIVNIITPKKTHRKPNTQQSPLEPSKPFQSLYASPTEAPTTQLNRFYIPQRIRSDGTDVASQIQEPSRSFGNVRENFQAVVPPVKGEEFAGQEEEVFGTPKKEFNEPTEMPETEMPETEMPETTPKPADISEEFSWEIPKQEGELMTQEDYLSRIENERKKREDEKKLKRERNAMVRESKLAKQIEKEEKIKKLQETILDIEDEDLTPAGVIIANTKIEEEGINKPEKKYKPYKPNDSYIGQYSAITGELDKNKIIKNLQSIADTGPNVNRGVNVANWFAVNRKKAGRFEGQQASQTMQSLEQSRLQPQGKIERTQTNPELVYATSK